MNNSSHKVSYLGRLLPWFSLFVTCATLWFIFSVNGIALLVWEFVAFIYVLSVFAILWFTDAPKVADAVDVADADASDASAASHTSDAHPPKRKSTDRLDSWAWWMPLITSIAGVYAAVLALGANAQAQINSEAGVVAGIAAIGVALSWLILHIGFADVYAHVTAKHRKAQLQFPETTTPAHLDYLYFALTIGATFSTSDVTVLTTRMRRVVTLHSVISFFYNALIVAVVFQVLQQLVVASL